MRGKVLVACGVALATPALPQSVTILHDFVGGGGSSDMSLVEGISAGVQVGYYTYWDPVLPQGVGEPVAWFGTAKSRISLTPKGVEAAHVFGTNNGRHVGMVNVESFFQWATLWTGNGVETVDLHVDSIGGATLHSTRAEGIWGNQQVGYGSGGAVVGDRAILWNGTAASATSLHPSHLGFIASQATATDGTQQVGWGRTDDLPRALLWAGIAATAVDLTPANALFAEALGVFGGSQVGRAHIDGTTRAALWNGTATSFIDLHPEGAFSSKIVASNGVWHVGSVSRNAGPGRLDDEHAVAWNAVTLEMIDLHTLLPAGFQVTPSWATSIDEMGNIGGVATSSGTSVYNERAVIWTVPEPTTIVSLSAATLGLIILRRRKR